MKVTISGADRTGDLGNEIRRAALDLRCGDPASLLTPEVRLLARRQTKTDAEYREWVCRIANVGCENDPVDCRPGPRPGRAGAVLLRLRMIARRAIRGWSHGTRPPDVHTQVGALTLRESTCDSDYTRRLISLLKSRCHVDTNPFVMPRKPGSVGAVLGRLRIVLWQVMRFQADRITGRQNHVNTALVRAIEFEHEMRDREVAELRGRIAVLEAKAGHGPPAGHTP